METTLAAFWLMVALLLFDAVRYVVDCVVDLADDQQPSQGRVATR